MNGSDNKVALVFTAVIIGNDNNFTGFKSTQRLYNAGLIICH